VKILWLSRAVDDLERLRAYIAQDDPTAAETEVEKVIRSVGLLADQPALGRPGRIANTRELVVSSYVVAYRVKAEAVQVLRVLHAARKWPERLGRTRSR
jgi:addiction module RelE/StbE family toxin